MTATATRNAAGGDAMTLLVRDVSRHPLPTRDEALDLARRAKAGDLAARDELLRGFLRLAIREAGRYKGRGLDLPDLVSEAVLGLIRSVETFDPDRGIAFTTYGAHGARNAIRRAIVHTSRAVRLPAWVAGHLPHVLVALARFREEHRREPEEGELAAITGLRPRQVRLVRAALAIRTESVPEGTDPEGPGEPAEAGLDRDEESVRLRVALLRLPENEARVVRLRYGLDGGERLTRKQAADEIGITREWVNKLEIRGLARLRAALDPECESPVGNLASSTREAC